MVTEDLTLFKCLDRVKSEKLQIVIQSSKVV